MTGVTVIVVFIIALLVIGGIYTQKLRIKDEMARMEREILKVAQQEGGRIQADLVALEIKATLAEVERALRIMLKEGRVDYELDDRGSMVFLFPGFLDNQGV